MLKYCLGTDVFVRGLQDLEPAEIAFWNDRIDNEPAARRAFMSYEFAQSCARTGRSTLVLVAYEDGAPACLLPLQKRKDVSGWSGAYEPVGGVMTDYFGILAADGVAVDVCRWLTASRLVGAVVYSHLDETQTKHGVSVENRRTGLRTRIDPKLPYWDALKSSDRKLAGDTDRRQRKLETELGASLKFEWCSLSPASDLVWLIDYKQRQYATTGRVDAPLRDPDNVALLRDLASGTSPRCTGVLSVLRCADRIVAAHFGLRCHDVLHVWFPVYDPALANYSPGRLLFKHMFSSATSQGISLFDRGEGDTPAKRDFANESHEFGMGVWRAANVRGAVARTAVSLSWRLEAVRQKFDH